ncbi:MAG: hypothetical protein JNK82_38000 [Myxococcaceae bacterium]|nr:hypothetical protein [Myxococcaceae bacterium]
MKVLRVVVVVALVGGLGGAGYTWFTRLDRAAAAIMLGPPNDDDLLLLAAHPETPQAAKGVDVLSEQLGPYDCVPARLQLFDAVLTAQKLPDATVAARVLNRCTQLSPKRWGPYSGAEVARGVRTVLREEFRGEDADPLIGWLEDSKAGVSEDVLVAVALALGTSAKAARYFEAGFPADGQPLTAEPLMAPAGDSRLGPALAEAVLQYGRLGPNDKRTTPAIAKAAAVVKVPVTDEVIAAVTRMGEAGLEDAARAILGGTPAERISKVIAERESWAVTSGRRTAILDAVGADSSGDLEAMFQSVRGLDSDAWNTSEGEKLRDDTINRSQIGLRSMGARAVPAAHKYLADPDARVRSLALEHLFAFDRAHFSQAVFEASPKLSYRDLDRALELAGAEDDRLMLHFAALAVPQLVVKVKKKLLEQRADVLVPALFALLAHRESFSPDEVEAYQRLLADCPGSGPVTARELAKALESAGGRPEAVYWLAKLLALRHLTTVGGGAAEKAVVAKFVADASGYDDVRIKYVNGKETSREPTRVAFAGLAAEAMKQLR